MSDNALQLAIRQLAFGASLTVAEASEAFGVIMRGEATPAQVAGLLMALRIKGETIDEVAGAASALRAAMVHLEAADPGALVETCGTGGGSITTFNISTAAALLAAGLGVRVAKHGNRSFTSQCGSADVLEALGVPLDVSPTVMARALRDAGIVFMFAPSMHPAMRHVGPVRRELAVPTVMNIVGPLANPASSGRQVLGVAEMTRMALLAGALAALGTRHALVVHGEPGMDEFSPLGRTRVVEVRGGTTCEWFVDPAEHGFGAFSAESLAGGSPTDNARIVTEVLGGSGSPAATAAVILNAAAALYVGGQVPSYAAGVGAARDGVRAGVGLVALDRLRRAYTRAD
ncbi:MAG: anthranilate phosphoribosyltransferase [Gemmatimonadaceae bacterium]|nr:anthranilate phosphoribosyltransferase [Gemmatimonadaceae bacterium]